MKNLNCAFKPKRVAIIGASPDPKKIGHQIIKNVIDGGYEGEIIPINPNVDQGCRKQHQGFLRPYNPNPANP